MIEWLAAAGVAALGLSGYATLIEPRRAVLRRMRLVTNALPKAAKPVRIGIMSDLHAAWPHMERPRIEALVAAMLDERPDLVLLPGDFVTVGCLGARTLTPAPIAAALAPLAEFAPTLAVLGNHDWKYDAAGIAGALRAVGIDVLQNEARVVELAAGPLQIAGVDCLKSRQGDVEATFRSARPGVPTILMSHIPDAVIAVAGRAFLTIAGHTHGGQIRLPFRGPLLKATRLPRELSYGLHSYGTGHLLVTAGLGTATLPIRLGIRPEYLLLELQGCA